MGVYTIHWAENRVTGPGGALLDRYNVYAWERIEPGCVGDERATRTWNESGTRWAQVHIDWSGPGRLEDTMGPHECLSNALEGIGGFRLVAAGLGSGLAHQCPIRREPKKAATAARDLDGQRRFEWAS